MACRFGHAGGVAPVCAGAQGVSFSAYGEAEYAQGNGNSETGFAGGVSFTSEPGAAGLAGLGLDASLRVLRVNSTSFYTLYLAPSIALGPAGKLSFGAPEPVMNGLYDGPILGGTYLFDPLLRSATGSFTDSAYFTDVINVPLGVRYDGTAGPVSFGASLHRLSDVDATALELVARYPLGKVSLAGGVEVLNDGSTTESRFVLGGSGDAGVWGGGLYYYNESFVTGESGLRGYRDVRADRPRRSERDGPDAVGGRLRAGCVDGLFVRQLRLCADRRAGRQHHRHGL